jgi:Domain of unknown function (DUF4258)
MKMFLTVHAKQRMALRLISHKEIVESLKNGDWKKDKEDKIIAEYGKVKVVFHVNQEEGVLTVITVIPSKKFSQQIRRYVRNHKVSYRVATKTLKNIA